MYVDYLTGVDSGQLVVLLVPVYGAVVAAHHAPQSLAQTHQAGREALDTHVLQSHTIYTLSVSCVASLRINLLLPMIY